jgi:hypothetical protein
MADLINLPETIYNREKFSQNLPLSFDGTFDWTWTQGCFGETKIKPTDIDAIVERKGNFLVFETKTPGIEVPQGQMILLNNLVKTGYFTVMIIWGKMNPEKFIVMFRNWKKEYYGVEEAKNIVTKWFHWANGKGAK